MNQLHYYVTGERRKALVRTVSEILGKESAYMGAPTFAYQVGLYIIDKDGALISPDPSSPETISLREKLETHGFIPVESEEDDQLVVEFPRTDFSEDAYCNLQKLIRSKAALLKKVLDTNSLEIEMSDDKLFFPWFTLHGLDGEVDAYNRLVTALCQMAKNATRVTAKEHDTDNEKYTFRLFLIRLGFVGKEYKTARKILLRNLTGNSSWRSGHAPEQAAAIQNEGGEPYEK